MPLAAIAARFDFDNLFGRLMTEGTQRVLISVPALTRQDPAQRRQIGPRGVILVDVGSAAIRLPRVILRAVTENVKCFIKHGANPRLWLNLVMERIHLDDHRTPAQTEADADRQGGAANSDPERGAG